MALTIKSIVPIVVALVIMGAILSLAIEPLTTFGTANNVTIDGTSVTIASAYPTLTTMVATLIPVLAVIGIALMFMNRGKN
jgi:hypothetical protein